jgi:hypothetical protein
MNNITLHFFLRFRVHGGTSGTSGTERKELRKAPVAFAVAVLMAAPASAAVMPGRIVPAPKRKPLRYTG